MGFEQSLKNINFKKSPIQKSVIVTDEISRTTIEMPTGLKIKAKQRCAETRTSFKDYIIGLVNKDLGL